MSETTSQATILKITQLTPTILGLSCKPEEPFSFQAGQYVELSFPPLSEGEEKPFWPMAIASGSEDELLQFAIRQSSTSRLAPYLSRLQEGQTIQFKGPKGKGLYCSEPHRQIGIIATGTGFAPMRSILRSEPYKTHCPPTKILLGVNDQDEILYQTEWEEETHIQLIPVLFQPKEEWQGATGWVTDILATQPDLFDWKQTDFYLCGQPSMTEKAIEQLLAYGVLEGSIHKA